MDAKNSSDVTLIERKNRAEKGLALMNLNEAKELTAVMNDCTVKLNLAEAASAKADTAAKAEAEVEATGADVAAVLAAIPFMVRTFDPAHFAKLPKAETYADTSVDYRREHLLPVLREGGKFSQVMGEALEEAIAKEDKAKRHLASAGAHDAHAKDREKLARKELTIAIHKAELYIQSNTSPGEPARLAIKRPRTTDTRSYVEKAQAMRDQADKILERGRKREAAQAAKAARKSGQGAVAAPGPARPQAATTPAPSLTVVA